MASQSAAIYINSFRWRLGIIRPVHHVAPCRIRAAVLHRVSLGTESGVLNPYGNSLLAGGSRANFVASYVLTVTEKIAPQKRRIRFSTHSSLTAASD